MRRHLKSHNIVALKQQQKILYKYHNDPHSENEQQENDNFIINWIVCDAQSFSIMECEEW